MADLRLAALQAQVIDYEGKVAFFLILSQGNKAQGVPNWEIPPKGENLCQSETRPLDHET